MIELLDELKNFIDRISKAHHDSEYYFALFKSRLSDTLLDNHPSIIQLGTALQDTHVLPGSITEKGVYDRFLLSLAIKNKIVSYVRAKALHYETSQKSTLDRYNK